MSAALTLAGSALLAGSANTSKLIAVRTVQGLGIGMAICLGPLYLTEAAPPHRRGLLSGLAPMGFAVGLTLYVSSLYAVMLDIVQVCIDSDTAHHGYPSEPFMDRLCFSGGSPLLYVWYRVSVN